MLAGSRGVSSRRPAPRRRPRATLTGSGSCDATESADIPVELVVFIAVLPAITALAGVALGQWWQSRRDSTSHKRAAATARAARMRQAFVPVVVAAMGIKAAAGEYFMSSGDPRENAKVILEKAMATVNEARAQLMIEDDLTDVFEHFEKVWRAFDGIQFEIGGRLAGRGGAGMTADEMKDAYAVVNAAPMKLAELMNRHLRAIERA